MNDDLPADHDYKRGTLGFQFDSWSSYILVVVKARGPEQIHTQYLVYDYSYEGKSDFVYGSNFPGDITALPSNNRYKGDEHPEHYYFRTKSGFTHLYSLPYGKVNFNAFDHGRVAMNTYTEDIPVISAQWIPMSDNLVCFRADQSILTIQLDNPTEFRLKSLYDSDPQHLLKLDVIAYIWDFNIQDGIHRETYFMSVPDGEFSNEVNNAKDTYENNCGALTVGLTQRPEVTSYFGNMFRPVDLHPYCHEIESSDFDKMHTAGDNDNLGGIKLVRNVFTTGGVQMVT